jgi:alkaline phosphatase
MRGVLRLLALSLLLVTPACSGSKGRGKADKPPRAKYVFLFIGDGMGLGQIDSARVLKTLEKRRTLTQGLEGLGFTEFDAAGLVTTYAADALVTDSAAAATALATGHKTNVGFLGVAADGHTPLSTVAEIARDRRMNVGIVTSVSLDHATPAAFYAKQSSRSRYYDIAYELAESGFNFFAAGGFLQTEPPAEEQEGGGGGKGSPFDAFLLPSLAPAGSGSATPFTSAPAPSASAQATGSGQGPGSTAPGLASAGAPSLAGASASAIKPLGSSSAAPSASGKAPSAPKAKRKRKRIPIIELLGDNQYLVSRAKLSRRGELVTGAPEGADPKLQAVPYALEPVLEKSKWSILIDEDLDAEESLPYAIDRQPGQASLADYTRRAISKLDGPSGFFLMVEGGKIDWASHQNDAVTAAREVLDFARAVDVALEFYEKHADETLIVVTADHETGGLFMGGKVALTGEHALRALKQRMSAQRFASLVEEQLKRDPNAPLQDFSATLRADFGLILPMGVPEEPAPKPRATARPQPRGKATQAVAPAPALPDPDRDPGELTAPEIAELRAALELTRARVLAPSATDKAPTDKAPAAADRMKPNHKGLTSEDPFTQVVLRCFARRAGFVWTTREHTASMVPVFAKGFGADRFDSLLDNTDIGRHLIQTIRGEGEASPDGSAQAAEETPSAAPSGSAAASSTARAAATPSTAHDG